MDRADNVIGWLAALPAGVRSLVEGLALQQPTAVGQVLQGGYVQVQEGSLRVVATTPAGREVTVSRLGPGAAWFELPETVVRVREAGSVLVVDEAVVAVLVEQQPRVRRARQEQLDHQRCELERALADVEPAPPAPRELTSVTVSHAPTPTVDEVPLTLLAEQPAARRRRGRAPLVWQLDAADCGAAVLASTARALGVTVSLAHARDAVGAGLEGTSLVGLVEGAAALGIEGRMVKTSEDRLDDVPLPAILHLDDSHWVVADRVTAREVRLMDPSRGRTTISRDELRERWTGYAAVFDGAVTPKPPSSRALDPLRWIGQHLRPERNRLLLAVFLAFATSGLQMLAPTFSGYVIDDVITPKRLDRLPVLVAAMATVLVLGAAIGFGQRALLSWSATKVDAAALDSLMSRLLSLPVSYFASRRIGDIQRRLAGLSQIRSLAVTVVVTGLAAITQLVVALILMLGYSTKLTLIFLATVPVYVVVLRMASRRLRPRFENLEEAWGLYGSKQIEALKGIETVKAQGAEDVVNQRLSDQFSTLRRRLYSTEITAMGYEAVLQLVAVLSLVVTLTVGAREVVQGDLTLGGLVAFNGLAALASGPISTGLALFDQLQLVRTLFDRLGDVLDQEPEAEGITEVARLDGRIDVAGLTFTYPGPTQTAVLHDISVSIPAGALVAIIGRSGSGKSTLARCLAGLLPVARGQLLFDGQDAVDLGPLQVRREVGVVLAGCDVFDGTVADNISFGAAEADDEKIAWAAGTAGLGEGDLPSGLETLLGENGVHLSAGQLQRLALARAVYREPPILVLDEPTAHLDAESRRIVREGIHSASAGRTTFIVSHDAVDARTADLVLVLDAGRLVERGTPQELAERDGLYQHLQSLS